MPDIEVIEVLVPGQPGAKGATGDKGDKGDTGDVTPAALDAAHSAEASAEAAASFAAAAAVAATTISAGSWAALAAITPVFIGQRAQVSANDGGTHSGRTAASPDGDTAGVANAGVYGAYALAAGAWRRDAGLSPIASATPAQVVTGTAIDLAVTPEGAKAALDARIKGAVVSQTPSIDPYHFTFTVTGPDGLPWVLAAFQKDGRLLAKLSPLSEVPEAAMGNIPSRVLPDNLRAYSNPDAGYLLPFTAVGPDGQPWLIGGFQKDGKFLAKLSPLSEVPVSALGSAAARLLPDGVEMYVTGSDSPYLVVWDAGGGVLGGFLKDGSMKAKFSSECMWPETFVTDAHAVSGPGVIIHGDSLASALGVADFQAAFPGSTFVNDARGSQTSTEIAARQGGVPLTVSVQDDTILASGSTTITAISADVIRNAGVYSPAAGGLGTCFLAGVAGIITATAANAYVFTRSASGDAVACPPGSQVSFASAAQSAYDTMYIWSGHNNVGASQTVVDDIVAMIRYHKARGVKRVRVMTLVNDGYNNAGANALMRKTFPSHILLDMRQIILDRGLADCGITPTSDDTAALAVGNIPPSLKADSIHLTSTAHQLCVRPAIIRDLKLMGWL